MLSDEPLEPEPGGSVQDDTTRGCTPVSGSVVSVDPEAGAAEEPRFFRGLEEEGRRRETRMFTLDDPISTTRERAATRNVIRRRIIKATLSPSVANGDNFKSAAAVAQEPSRSLFISPHLKTPSIHPDDLSRRAP